MRYQPTHAAPRERVPFALWGPTSVRTALSAAVAATAALVPCVMVASPAQAAVSTVLTVGNASAVEGAAATFTLTYTGTGPATFNLATAAVNATAGSDYTTTPDPNSVTFPGTTNGTTADNTKTVKVATLGDTVREVTPETFSLTATDAQAPNDTASGTGTITDSWTDFALTSSSPISEASTTTTNGNQVNVVSAKSRITATLAAPVTHSVTIPVKTVDGAAISNLTNDAAVYNDFTALSNTSIVIPAGQLSGFKEVTINDDDLDEDNLQDFSVQVDGSATGASALAGGSAVTIEIQDNDATPSVSIGGAGLVTEGAPLGFPLTLSGKSEKTVSVAVTTADGVATANTYGATAGSDYTALTGTPAITFPATTTSATALVSTINDTAVESSPESLTATISSPTNATLGTPTTATGGINDNEPAPKVTLSPSSFAENGVTPGGERTVDINVSLDSASDIPVKLDYTFGGGTATSGTDYKGTAGSLTIAPGVQTAKIPVTIVDDMIFESPNETFNVTLSSPNMSVDSSTLGAQQITITDNETAPTFSVANIDTAEGNTGTKVVRVPVMLSGPVSNDVRLGVTIVDDTAVSTGLSINTTVGDDDYEQPLTAFVTIPAGSTTGYFDVTVNSDAVFERNESANITVAVAGETRVSNTIAQGMSHTAKMTINNDDAAPTMTFNETSGTEGTTLRVTGTVSGVAQANIPLALTFQGVGEAPASPTDYDATGAQTSFTINRGVTGAVQIANVFLQQDTIDEAVESFSVRAAETVAQNQTPIGFVTSNGVYRINDDPGDLPPTGAITDESIKENEGSVDVTVNLEMQGDTTSTQQAWTVPWSTVDGSAKSGMDYVKSSGTLSIPAGTMSGKINVEILNDKMVEPNEDFFIKLGTAGPGGAAVKKGTGIVTIQSEDVADPTDPTDPTDPAASITLAGPAYRVGAGPIKLSGKTDPNAMVQLWSAPYNGGDDDWMEDGAEVKASATGTFTFDRTLKNTGMKYVAHVGDAMSDEVQVALRQAPAFTATSSAKGSAYVKVTGGVGGSKFLIQRRNASGAWVTAFTGNLLSNGAYNRTLTGQPSGSVTYRVYVYGSSATGVQSATSAAGTVRVR